MTSHAQRRRRKLAAKLDVTTRSAANIIRARTAERRARGEAGTQSPPTVSLPSPTVRHFYLQGETCHDVTVTVDMQTVAHFIMGGGPLTNAASANGKFAWFSTWETHIGPTRALWVIDKGTWGLEWEPTERELHDLADKAMADELLHRFKYVLVLHAPNKLAMIASDRPLPHGIPTSAMRALPRQPITEGAPPSWWPDGTKRQVAEELPKRPSPPAKGAIYILPQIVQGVRQLLNRRPKARRFTTTVNSYKEVDARVGEVAMLPLVDLSFVEEYPGQWYFDGELAFIEGELNEGSKSVGVELFETDEGRKRLAKIIVAAMDPWLVSVLGHFSVKSGFKRGDNLIAEVSLSVIDKQEQEFGELLNALERADGQVSMAMSKAALGIETANEPIRAAIRTAREALARVQAAAETPRQKKLAKRALGYEAHWKRNEESLNRIDAMNRGVLPPIR